ncbi:hypothetical protein [Nocardiopsis alba]|uniref:hypothetical protein n=1 Tax=Nocardiopsis alba TaxID=53437 RepID=UPI003D71A5E5
MIENTARRYTFKPREVEAAQWTTNRPGDVIGLLANHRLDWERDGDKLTVICADGDRLRMGPGCWVVIDDDEIGNEVQVHTDDAFRVRWEA